MKKLLFLPLIVLAVMFASCSEDDKQTIVDGGEDNNAFVVEGSECEVAINSDFTLTIVIKSAKFAEKMPAMDIILPNVPYYKEADNIIILASEVVPEVVFGGVQGPYHDYVINNFSGSIISSTLSFQGYMHLGKIVFNGDKAGNNYKGTTIVTYPDDPSSVEIPAVDITEYPNVKSTFVKENDAVTITLLNVSFAPKMPIMNIRINSLPAIGENIYFNAEVEPEASIQIKEGVWTPFAPAKQFIMSDVNCVVDDSSLLLTFTLSMGHMRYEANVTSDGYVGLITISNIAE